jgi:glycosyltransferase involved in cell wall biosynthesis
MKPTMYFLMNSIDLMRGGLTRASLKQASYFAEMGYDTYMLTFNYNARYPSIRKKLIQMNKVHKDVKILNMYEDLEEVKHNFTLEEEPKKANLSDLAGDGYLDKRKDHNAYRVYSNGLYIKYISLHEDDSLDFIDYFNENRYRTRREHYDPNGKLKAVAYMDYVQNKPRQTIYYNNIGNAYLSVWETPSTGKVNRINLFNKDGSIKKVHLNGLEKRKIAWIKKMIKNSNNPIVISDTRSTDQLLIDLNSTNALKFWRIHSSHVAHPFKPDSPITKKIQVGIDNLDEFDAVLVLTEEQKNDIISRYGELSNIYVVPHYYEHFSSNPLKPLFRKIQKNPNLAVIVSRFSTLKRIDHTIKAFKKVVEQIPEAKLEIWGFGDEQSHYESLIKELSLSDNVLLKGYSYEPEKIYGRGLFSVLTSKSEGFALSILESMANETPVISYPIKYGPSDLIQHKQTGIILEEESIDKLAEEMISLFNNPKTAKKMGEEAYKFVRNSFGKEMYEQKWNEVINNVQKH